MGHPTGGQDLVRVAAHVECLPLSDLRFLKKKKNKRHTIRNKKKREEDGPLCLWN